MSPIDSSWNVSYRYFCECNVACCMYRSSFCVLVFRVCFPSPCSDIVSAAKFVLIVEKDATFQRLLDDDFCTKLSPCIMITVCFLFSFWWLEWYWSQQRQCCGCLTDARVCVCVRVKACQMWTAGWWWGSFGTRCTSPPSLWWMLTLTVHHPPLTHTSHTSTHLTALDSSFHLHAHTVGLHVPLSRQMLAPAMLP